MERLYETSVVLVLPPGKNQRLIAYNVLIPTWWAVVSTDGSVPVDWHCGDMLYSMGQIVLPPSWQID